MSQQVFRRPKCCRRHQVEGPNGKPCSHAISHVEWSQIRTLAQNLPESLRPKDRHDYVGMNLDLLDMEVRAEKFRIQCLTMKRWLEADDFLAEVRDFRRDVVSRLMENLCHLHLPEEDVEPFGPPV